MQTGEAGAAAAGTPGRARILVVEDEALIALMIMQMLERLGLEPVGPAATSREALALIAAERIDAALLDLRLGDEGSPGSVAPALERRGIPFVVVTGFLAAHVRRLIPGHPVLTKPFSEAALGRALGRLLGPPLRPGRDPGRPEHPAPG
jgi:CheY-like chemotaxis protein